jgi:hypothetical protein
MPGSTEDHWGRQDAAQAIALVSSLLPSLSVFITMYSLVFSCGFAQADGVYLLGCQDHVECGDSKTRHQNLVHSQYLNGPHISWKVETSVLCHQIM